MSSIFSKPGVMALGSSDSPKLADICITDPKDSTKFTTATLPLVDIPEFSHTSRQQVESSLSGDLYVLTSPGGTATCTLTFVDRIGECLTKSNSALTKYRELQKQKTPAKIQVNIYDLDGKVKLASFAGVLNGCSVKTTASQNLPILLVSYTMTGIWE